ncbi:MAG: DNA mismatch repair endonuclease MutL [Culicoidibacterales bacterium]
MNTIKVMGETLSNKIAAGEVVERPKSIVKELVENALDAQAKIIKVLIEDAGIRKIIVDDDGSGMSEDDALLSFQRHATSKIFTELDLFNIGTLGFRGEALAAISSISKISLHTGKANRASTLIKIAGGVLEEVCQKDERLGTKIVVENIFYNTPARLKHLKSSQTEYMHIFEYLQKMSLARTDVRFEFVADGRLVFKTYGTGKIEQTLAMIYGDKIANYYYEFSAQDGDFSVSGIITHPQMQRSNNKVINLAINSRTVRHYGINRAIISGYGNLLPKGMYPIVAINVEVDTQLVDVNVHPAKLEVRLSQEKQLEDLVKKAVEETLITENLIYKNTSQPRKIKSSEQYSLSLENTQKQHLVAEKTELYVAGPRKVVNYPNGVDVKRPSRVLTQAEQQAVAQIMPVAAVQQVEVQKLVEISALAPSLAENAGKKTAIEVLRQLSVIGQFDATYILAQRDTSLYLIDQHAAQERIKYEQHMRAVRNDTRIPTQDLLFPLSIHLELEALNAVKAYKTELEKNGINLELFGVADVRVNSVPTWIQKLDIEVFIRKAIDCLVMYGQFDNAIIREKELIMLSCKYSIKAHDQLDKVEMEKLIYELSETEIPYTCPHGRPIVIEHSKYEVERWFKRA